MNRGIVGNLALFWNLRLLRIWGSIVGSAGMSLSARGI